jgi:phosphoglycolate phosphatase-like HAD superfamily hydrolase
LNPRGELPGGAEDFLRHRDEYCQAIEKMITQEIGIWKPEAPHVLLGIEAIDVAPDRFMFIGDGQLDMVAVRGARMTSVHLSKETGPGCDYRVADVWEAIALI